MYVVIMYRYGDTESHSYLLGVFENQDLALSAGDNESQYRGRKYYPQIVFTTMNAIKERRVVLDCGEAMLSHNWDEIIRGE